MAFDFCTLHRASDIRITRRDLQSVPFKLWPKLNPPKPLFGVRFWSMDVTRCGARTRTVQGGFIGSAEYAVMVASTAHDIVSETLSSNFERETVVVASSNRSRWDDIVEERYARRGCVRDSADSSKILTVLTAGLFSRGNGDDTAPRRILRYLSTLDGRARILESDVIRCEAKPPLFEVSF